MKLQIAFDTIDLEQALHLARSIEPHVDVIEIGTLLIYQHGEKAISEFRKAFPQKTLFADAKIIDRSKDAIPIFTQAGADWVTIMAGAGRNVIHTGCTVAHTHGAKVMLDLSDASSPGQAALDAKSLGVDSLLFHIPSTNDDQLMFVERWEMVKGNSTLPVWISSLTTRETIHEILSLGAAGVVLGSTVTNAPDPAEEASYFASALGRKS